jgi:hypothetical protein
MTVGPYDEATRLYGPPKGTFDAEWVTRMLRLRRPELAWAEAALLVGHAWRHLWASPQLSPEELAGYCALDVPHQPEDLLADVVACVVDFCDAYEVEPPRFI